MCRFRCLLGLVLLAGPAGCQDFGRPRLLNPGTAQQQQARAERFDPFPQNDVGPSTVSTRPPGFEHEYAEPERARFVDNHTTMTMQPLPAYAPPPQPYIPPAQQAYPPSQ